MPTIRVFHNRYVNHACNSLHCDTILEINSQNNLSNCWCVIDFVPIPVTKVPKHFHVHSLAVEVVES